MANVLCLAVRLSTVYVVVRLGACTCAHIFSCSLHTFTFFTFTKICKWWIQIGTCCTFQSGIPFSLRLVGPHPSMSAVQLCCYFFPDDKIATCFVLTKPTLIFFFSFVHPFVAGLQHHILFGQKVPQAWTMWLHEPCSLFIKTAPFEMELMSFQQPFGSTWDRSIGIRAWCMTLIPMGSCAMILICLG